MPTQRHTSGADTTPQIIFLPAGDAIIVQKHEGGLSCGQIAGGNILHLSGEFAAGLSALLKGRPDRRHISILNQLSHQHPWLYGLAQASTSPVRNLPFILGQGLGMLFIEMTARCNERCLHCYAESGPNRTEALSLQEIHGVLAQARAFGNPTVQFTGGDPMIHPDLAAAVKLASELSYPDIEIYTNGLLLNPRLLSQLAPFSPRFAFSLYSHNASVHDRITRVSGSFERTIAAIRRTKEAGLGVRIGATLMPENQGQEQEISRFIETEIGLPPSHIHFAKMKSVGRGSDRHEAAPADGGSKGHHGRLSETKNQHRQASVRKRYGKLCVAADGNVYPCIFSRHTLLGNIHKQGLTEILHALDQRTLPEPSAVRWESCRQSLSCRDCQIISYALGMENEHAAA